MKAEIEFSKQSILDVCAEYCAYLRDAADGARKSPGYTADAIAFYDQEAERAQSGEVTDTEFVPWFLMACRATGMSGNRIDSAEVIEQ